MFKGAPHAIRAPFGARTFAATAGDVVVVDPGTPHNFWNKTGVPVRMNVEVRPALELESLLETMYGLAADGKTNRWGMPNPFRLAVIADAHFDVVRDRPVYHPTSVRALRLAPAA